MFPLRRIHQALLPDYNVRAATYWWTMVSLGTAALAWALWRVWHMPVDVVIQVAIGTTLAVIAGFFPVRVPHSKHSFVAGEVFIFLLLLMHGPAAAVMAASGEALMGVWRSSKRWSSRIASPAMSALAMTLAGLVMEGLFALIEVRGAANAGVVLLTGVLVALTYFAANSLIVSFVFTFKLNQRFDFSAYFGSFGTIGVAYCGSALIAALLQLTVAQSGVGVLLGALPVIALLLATIHYFLRQQEAADAVRQSKAEAAAREQQQLAHHMSALSESERRFHSAFTHASIGMVLVSFDGRVLQANESLTGMLGAADARSLAGRPFEDLAHPDDRASLEQALAPIKQTQSGTAAAELRFLHAGGAEIWVALDCGLFSEAGSGQPCLIVQVQDISARRHAESQLNHIAFHDGLTGLPNRGRFHSILTRALEALAIDDTRHFAVMFLDFDRFKLINDSMGHSAGDQFLIQVSRRLQDHVRPGDVVARLGGDEFAVLAMSIGEESEASRLAERLQTVLREPMTIDGVSVSTSASIGITFSRLGYTAPEEMLRDADIAMYRAKTAGKARHALFDSRLHKEVADRMTLENDLRQAVKEGALEIAYQPLYALNGARLIGFEALARWNHAERGAVSPLTFIPVAEEAGLMVELTDLVLDRACAQVRLWQERAGVLGDLKLQVNLSGADLSHGALYERIERTLRHTRFAPRLLTLELTENILMTRVEGAIATLESLRRLGVSLAIDDFGTGYSSLSYLSTLPIDSLKIDRSFVHGMRNSRKDAEIVRAIVSLGTTLGKSVVAEGIETQSQLMQLHDLGCEHGQGFHLSRPLTPAQVEALLDFTVAAQAGERLTGFDTIGATPLLRH
jgi:diguanylate cyclase (GGDEF)-like protein/PAS domain S-box-containing protein